MLYRYKVFVVFIVLTACGSEPVLINNSAPDLMTIVVDNGKVNDVSSYDNVVVERITVSEELSRKIGSDYIDCFKVGSNFLLSNMTLGVVSIIDAEGKLLTILKPPSPELDRYESLGTVEVNEASEEIYVEDDVKHKLDIFSYAGEYLRSVPQPIPQLDLAILDQGRILYTLRKRMLNHIVG